MKYMENSAVYCRDSLELFATTLHNSSRFREFQLTCLLGSVSVITEEQHTFVDVNFSPSPVPEYSSTQL
jgi:hypothetical protein